MRRVGLVVAGILTIFFSSPAFGCVMPRSWEDELLFWLEPPEQVGADEVVLEVQFLPQPDPTLGSRDFVVSDCGVVRYYRYSVTRVLHGEFERADVYVPSSFGKLGTADRRHVLVGKISSGHDVSRTYFRARRPPLETVRGLPDQLRP